MAPPPLVAASSTRRRRATEAPPHQAAAATWSSTPAWSPTPPVPPHRLPQPVPLGSLHLPARSSLARAGRRPQLRSPPPSSATSPVSLPELEAAVDAAIVDPVSAVLHKLNWSAPKTQPSCQLTPRSATPALPRSPCCSAPPTTSPTTSCARAPLARTRCMQRVFAKMPEPPLSLPCSALLGLRASFLVSMIDYKLRGMNIHVSKCEQVDFY